MGTQKYETLQKVVIWTFDEKTVKYKIYENT